MEEMDRKDVGILAMDIYFPPSCVQQVKLFSQLLTVRVTISVLLLRPTPLRGDSDASDPRLRDLPHRRIAVRGEDGTFLRLRIVFL